MDIFTHLDFAAKVASLYFGSLSITHLFFRTNVILLPLKCLEEEQLLHVLRHSIVSVLHSSQ